MTKTRLDGERSYRKPYGELRDGKPRPLYDRIYIDPAQNVIIGSRNIARYIGVGSLNTIWEWTEQYGLPIIKRPDGMWMTTMTAIDQWIFIAAHIVEEMKIAGVMKAKGNIGIAAKRAALGTGLVEPSAYRKRNGKEKPKSIPIEPSQYEIDRAIRRAGSPHGEHSEHLEGEQNNDV